MGKYKRRATPRKAEPRRAKPGRAQPRAGGDTHNPAAAHNKKVATRVYNQTRVRRHLKD